MIKTPSVNEKKVDAECQHDMRPSVELQRVSSVDSDQAARLRRPRSNYF